MDSVDKYPEDSLGSEICPDPGHPYYIFCWPYARYAAGVKLLHMLCHSLNRVGKRAFIYVYPDLPPGLAVAHPDYLTPRLTQDIIDHHYAEGKTPIVVYPESVVGNPVRAGCVARYILNFPGVFGGDLSFPPEEYQFGYTAELAAAGNQPENVLFVPISDTKIFYPPEPGTPRSGTCFYAVKYRRLYGGVPVPPDPDSIEITREQTPAEMAEIFRRCELLYCFESSSTALDAALCGCPTIYMPGPFLPQLIADGEFGEIGYAIGNTPEAIAHARATVGNVRLNYDLAFRRYWRQLDRFIEATQKKAAETPYASPLHTGLRRYGPWSAKLARRVAILRGLYWLHGFSGVLRHIWMWRVTRRRANQPSGRPSPTGAKPG